MNIWEYSMFSQAHSWGWASPHSQHFTAGAIGFHHKVLLGSCLFSWEGTDFNALIFHSGKDKTCLDLKKKNSFFSVFSCVCMVIIHLNCICKSYRKPSTIHVCSQNSKQQLEIRFLVKWGVSRHERLIADLTGGLSKIIHNWASSSTGSIYKL